MKKGSLVKHKNTASSDKVCRLEPDLGIGIIIESWENQVIFDGVPEHDPCERVVLFDSGYRVLKTSDLELVDSTIKRLKK